MRDAAAPVRGSALLNVTVTSVPPGENTKWTVGLPLPAMVTVTVALPPAASVPDMGETTTFFSRPGGSETDQATGPPEAARRFRHAFRLGRVDVSCLIDCERGDFLLGSAVEYEPFSAKLGRPGRCRRTGNQIAFGIEPHYADVGFVAFEKSECSPFGVTRKISP